MAKGLKRVRTTLEERLDCPSRSEEINGGNRVHVEKQSHQK